MLETLDIIATRRLYFIESNGNRYEVTVEIGRPRSSQEPNEFFCPFRVSGIGDELIMPIYGVDEVQALQLAMNAVGPFLQHLNSTLGIALKWEAGRGDDLGFRPN